MWWRELNFNLSHGCNYLYYNILLLYTILHVIAHDNSQKTKYRNIVFSNIANCLHSHVFPRNAIYVQLLVVINPAIDKSKMT